MIVVTGTGRVSKLIADLTGAVMLTHSDTQMGNWPEHEIMIHAGARVFGEKSLDQPFAYFMDNVRDTASLLEDVRKRPPRLFIYISTYEVGDCRTPYAGTKLAAEALVQGWCNGFGIPWLIIRLPNLFILDDRDQGYIGKLRRGEITEPARPGRERQWLDGDVFVEEMMQLVELGAAKSIVTLEGEVYTDQQIAERVKALG